MSEYVYKIGNSAYINLTNDCTNACEFCIRNYKNGIKDYELWIDREPTVKEVLDLLGEVKNYDEVVFCGFGEPTCRLDNLVSIGRRVREKGGKVRLNTNGHGLLIYGEKIVDELVGAVDVISVSLNAPDKESYDKLCHPIYRDAYESMLEFTSRCAKTGKFDIRMSVMEDIGAESVEKCREIAKSLGATLLVRTMEK
ncbi:MAG: radical SAM protein [Clostridia bacterium]|nr:radical SAM protein [Clostridia bacterium]